MKKSKSRSQSSLASSKSKVQVVEEIYLPPLDELNIKVLKLQLSEETAVPYTIKVIFFDQLLLTDIIESVGTRQPVRERVLARGSMSYDPSDYEKMCLMADCPLVVNIHPMKSLPSVGSSSSDSSKKSSSMKPNTEISCCNIDILPLFIDRDTMKIKKRMEPMIKPGLLQRQSWDNLPLLTVQLSVIRNKENAKHHEILKRANYMKITLVGAYNLPISYDDEYVFTAASKTTVHNEEKTGLISFNNGRRVPNRFDALSFYPKWEYLRANDTLFTRGDEKFVCEQELIQNDDNIDLSYYMSKLERNYAIIWGSFRRTLLLPNDEGWLSEHLRRFCWPFELHLYGDSGGLSFMAFLQLFRLLYPGEHIARMAVPLHWVDPDMMFAKCNCEFLLTPNINQLPMDSGPTSSTEFGNVLRPTGADENCAFIVLEVKLAKPLKEITMPPSISSSEIHAMLQKMEEGRNKRECTGRGQLDRDWQRTVRAAEIALRKVPHYGMTEFCAFNRQLSETRTRVELFTSCWLSAALYVNNNFVVQEFIKSDKIYEEMLMMSHACLVRIVGTTLLGGNSQLDLDPTLRAARHARQMQDISHAAELYLQVVVNKPRGASEWRELSTCLMDVDRDWANVCINKSVVLNPRHRLSLLSKACTLYDKDPAASEMFFEAILTFFPFWTTGWVVANAYYTKRKLFHLADQITEYWHKTQEEGLAQNTEVIAWAHELGDWWDPTPFLPGINAYYIATDLLLRLRAFTHRDLGNLPNGHLLARPLHTWLPHTRKYRLSLLIPDQLAEICLSRGVAETGETATFFHLVALSCRLRGDVDDALCHLQLAIDRFGDLSYLRTLQAECYHKKQDFAAAMTSFEKAGAALGAYSILLSMPTWEKQRARSILLDLIRRQPSAYSWVALAEDWLQQNAENISGDAGASSEEQTSAQMCAVACAVQALKWDRQAGRAWALLSRLVAPSARRKYCQRMAETFGYAFTDKRRESSSESQQTLCYRLGRALRECRCFMCEHLKI